MANDADRNDRPGLDGVMRRRVDRRTVVGGASVAAMGMFGAGFLRGGGGGAAAAAPAALPGRQDLPEDAAPPEQQIFVAPDNAATAKVIDFYVKVYERPEIADLFSEPLVRLNKNFQIEPAAAEEWAGSEDGKTWTFTIRQGMTWSDGNPVTAADWVATFQNAADPAFAWDFTWFFQDVIKNWTQAVAGEVPPDQIGVRQGANEYELVVETEVPAPYLPAMLLYSAPLSKAALEANGPLYNTDPETAVSAGPFILSEWVPDQQIVYVKNEQYTGTLQVPVNQIVNKLASPDTFFTMYQNDEVDFMKLPPPAALEIMLSDPETEKEVYSGVGDFPTYYVFFDVTKAPFDNKLVRQAWSHAVDRDAIKEQVLGPSGTQAYSWLAPGFPASQREAVQDIQKFDPELGRQLLAEAGYPDGEGFPKQEMWLRAPTPLEKTVAGAIASMLKEHLNVDVELLERDDQGFTAALNAKPTEILLGFVRYGMDFFDPYNMLSVWLSGGRHSWSNPDFDAKVKAAAEFLGAPEERIAMFQEAERVLVEDVPGVFVYHGTEVQFIKPWVKGEFVAPDENGIAAMHWPNYTTGSTVPQELYIGADAPERG
jgi:peptide/nickel transport system substrate-binding protein/oligopeptide transport system substrate-binding protein